MTFGPRPPDGFAPPVLLRAGAGALLDAPPAIHPGITSLL